MAVLDRDLFGDELLLVQHRADTDGEDRQSEGQTVQRRRQRVEEFALGAVRLELPRPEQEDQQQGHARKAAQQKPVRDHAFAALLRLGARNRPPLVLVDDLDAVDLAAEFEQFLAGHRRELLVGRLTGFARLAGGVCALYVTVAHERAPIHRAAAMTATMPMIQAAMPSGAGPYPPRP